MRDDHLKVTRREFLNKVGTLSVLLPLFGYSRLSKALGGEGLPRPCRTPNLEPPLAAPPKESDVIMRSLCIRVGDSGDPHDTMRALEQFHATRLEWAYISDASYIKRVRDTGRIFGCAVSATGYIPIEKDSSWFERVAIKDLDGRPIIAPWKRTWERSLWGCMNNPELEAGYLRYLKQYIEAGAQVIHRDEPGGNVLATDWGGCFCVFCMERFRKYLEKNARPEELLRLGVNDITNFNYHEHLRKSRAPIGDAFGKWDGGDLKRHFANFQTDATVSFHKRTRQALNKYAGCEVPMTCNNGSANWGAIEQVYDWWLGELSYRKAAPETIYAIMHEAEKWGKHQVVTMPKKGDYRNLADWVTLTRQTIAMAYACGGHCMVPWDIFLPNNAPRYFGTPEQYADLYGFIRANAHFMDGFKELAAFGGKLAEKELPGLTFELLGNLDIYGIVRNLPEAPSSPLIVHLIDWSVEPKPFKLKLASDSISTAEGTRVQFLMPSDYVRKEHEHAESANNYANLSNSIGIEFIREGSLLIPQLDPWGLLVIPRS